MSKKLVLSFFSLLLSVVALYGQTLDSLKIKKGTFDTYEQLREFQKKVGSDTLTFLDSTFNFKVKLPNWLHLKETASERFIGGTLPPINGIENAILITSFFKSDFKSFDEFKYIFLTGNVFGQPTKYNKDHIWYGQKELIEIPNGVKQRVFTFWQNKIYYCEFILIETKTAYLWIQFTATKETYDLNISKFDEFMAGFVITNF